MKKTLLLIPLVLSLLCTACIDWQGDELDTFEGEGYEPIYMSREELEDVQVESSRAFEDPGKIYTWGNYLFISDRFQGIHIVDNSNPANPVKLAFVKVIGNVDVAVKGNTLYANNVNDLITLDIQNPAQPRLVNRIPDAFPAQNYPPFTNVHFECVDPNRGVVVGWRKTQLTQSNCFR